QGGPASGKTQKALEEALSHLEGNRFRKGNPDRRGVSWVGLPHQRPFLLRRLAQRAKAVLGLEYLLREGLYYRLAARMVEIRPLVLGLERLALVARALKEEGHALSPGLARLYAQAIAEHKRFGLEPQEEPLRSVHRRYEALKGGRWDYDDYRQQAPRLAQKAKPIPALLVVDGFRRHNPLDLEFALELGKRTEVLVTGVEFPEGLPVERLAEASPPRFTPVLYPNPIEELRLTLEALREDLLKLHPYDLLVVAPSRLIPGLVAMGERLGLPLWDGRPKSLLRPVLEALLSAHPTGLDLLVLASHLKQRGASQAEALETLARRVLEEGVAGFGAIRRLVENPSQEEALETYRNLKAALLEGRVREVLRELDLPHREEMRKLFQLAQSIDPQDPLPWWETLLREAPLPQEPIQGVPVLPPERAPGVRAEKAYLLHFSLEAYEALEREDPFVPEEARRPLALRPRHLPPRLSGDGGLFLWELLHRGEETVVSFPKADEDGPTYPLGLFEVRHRVTKKDRVARGEHTPEIPSGRWEPRIVLGREEVGRVVLESIKALDKCPGQFALRRLVRKEPPLRAWDELITTYAEERKEGGRFKGYGFSPEGLERAAQDRPEWAPFLERERDRLLETLFRSHRRVSFGFPLEVYALLGGVNGKRGEVYILSEGNKAEDRLSEPLYAHHRGLGLYVWTFGASPKPSKGGDEGSKEDRLLSRLEQLEGFLEEGFPLQAGWACGGCPVKDYCPLG
ncbi:MAG: hypothetical protein ACUVQC_05975, partial [Thermaceae bacterium]